MYPGAIGNPASDAGKTSSKNRLTQSNPNAGRNETETTTLINFDFIRFLFAVKLQFRGFHIKNIPWNESYATVGSTEFNGLCSKIEFGAFELFDKSMGVTQSKESSENSGPEDGGKKIGKPESA
ncbi:unnamed protein product [Darwinula stevensoni]|uniref:Uncharacterized protein n=1 Tax=Darwinula stevensoni TaxID=69355 RepID=A0A7R9ADW9_9CRUS|nr:unnamed protein product [Darwinula stevensoni]CAG0901163.1 unnamed protein product [Darwinula stevensoni]